MIVLLQQMIFRQDLRSNVATCVYLFGDNLERRGLGGQAKEMRGEPNAIGIPTKKRPAYDKDAFFTDAEFGQNVTVIDHAFASIPTDKIVIIPAAGIGTGLAALTFNAPETFRHLNRLVERLINTGSVD